MKLLTDKEYMARLAAERELMRDKALKAIASLRFTYSEDSVPFVRWDEIVRIESEITNA